LEVIRWFQLQSNVVVGLNTGRPESLREDTLRSLNTLGKEFQVEFKSELLFMNPSNWEADIAKSKAKGIQHFQNLGFEIFAFIDNEPANLKSVSEIDPREQILLLHADTLFESALDHRPSRSVAGDRYELTSLIQEDALPKHIQFVWNGVLENSNLRQFLGSGVHWGKVEIEQDELLRLEVILPKVRKFEKRLLVEFKGGLSLVDGVIDVLDRFGVPDQELWFHVDLSRLGEEGGRVLSAAFPKALMQCSVDFLSHMILADPEESLKTFQRLRQWGFKRFSVTWNQSQARKVIERLQSWGLEVHIDGVQNLEEFLQAALLLPRSIASDFNFPQWQYYGHGVNPEKIRYESGTQSIN